MATKKQQTSTMLLKMFTSIILLLGLCLSTKAARFNEAECRPRPTAVPTSKEHQYKPYHIVLYRCSGTFKQDPPSVKICVVKEQHDVMVDVFDESGTQTILTVKNHTKCEGECAAECGDFNIPDADCRCPTPVSPPVSPPVDVPSAGKAAREKTNAVPLPYMVGMALVGLFAVFVLVFDAMLYVKKKGFMHTIKHSCCGQAPLTDKNENQHYENEKMVRNEKETSRQTEV